MSFIAIVPGIKPEIDAAIQRVVDDAAFILGEEVSQFEKALAATAGAKDAVGVSSRTGALLLALLAVGVKPGDEVLLARAKVARPRPYLKV